MCVFRCVCVFAWHCFVAWCLCAGLYVHDWEFGSVWVWAHLTNICWMIGWWSVWSLRLRENHVSNGPNLERPLLSGLKNKTQKYPSIRMSHRQVQGGPNYSPGLSEKFQWFIIRHRKTGDILRHLLMISARGRMVPDQKLYCSVWSGMTSVPFSGSESTFLSVYVAALCWTCWHMICSICLCLIY